MYIYISVLSFLSIHPFMYLYDYLGLPVLFPSSPGSCILASIRRCSMRKGVFCKIQETFCKGRT